jgi:hypothetical protein
MSNLTSFEVEVSNRPGGAVFAWGWGPAANK